MAGGARRGASRLAWLDALRGFAALCVVFDHGTSLVLRPLHAYLYHWLNFGQYGVFVFFLVSGYIIPASLERKGSIRGFWISRAFRLYPLYLIAIAIAVVAYELGYGTLGGGQHHPLEAVASWLLMIPNLLSGPNVPNVTWTLSYEMVFYLLLAALFSVRAHRHSGGYAITCGIVVLAVGGILPMAALDHGHGLLVAREVDLAVDALIIAAIAASVSGSGRGGPARRLLPIGGAWLAALTGLFLVSVNQDNYPDPWSGYVILGFMFTGTLIYRAEQGQVSRARAAVITVTVLALMLAGGLWHGAQHPSLGTASTTWRWQWVTSLAGAMATVGIGLALRNRRVPRALAWLGMISYSVYLLHPLVLNAFRNVRALHDASTSLVVQIPLAIGLFMTVIGVSAVTYYVVEKPMQALGRNVARRWEGAGPAQPNTASAGAGTGPASGQLDAAVAGAATDAPAGGASARDVEAAPSAPISSPVAGGSGGSP
ncbi:MAG: acyltransferase 3 [Actinomycetia bacterium]|nr:acyltransferase 3 [Actinomycetes bacterium]